MPASEALFMGHSHSYLDGGTWRPKDSSTDALSANQSANLFSGAYARRKGPDFRSLARMKAAPSSDKINARCRQFALSPPTFSGR